MAGLLTIVRDLNRRRGRERRGLALAEGIRLVEEALAAGVPIRGALIAETLESTPRGAALASTLRLHGIPMEAEETSVFLEAAATDHPQGVVAVVEPPAWGTEDFQWGRRGSTRRDAVVLLDAVQDPGNVGTILRTAWGLGAVGLIALPGTVDLLNPKVLRGSMGASFRFPAVMTSLEACLPWLTEQEVTLWVAAADGQPVGSGPAATSGRIGLVVGNEGAGVRQELADIAGRRVGIPLRAEVESLNVAVAAALLLHEVLRDD